MHVQQSLKEKLLFYVKRSVCLFFCGGGRKEKAVPLAPLFIGYLDKSGHLPCLGWLPLSLSSPCLSFFFFKGKGAYDIAILVMHAKIRFSPNVKPICLPTQEIQDEDRKAFTAGYGLRYVSQKKEDAVLADKLKSSCLTNEIGPSTFKHCQGVEAEIFYFLLQQLLRPPFFTL